ncbi:unnamed protein product [Sphenostylis stenocarpa]|uniref:Inositol-tetrakisphosphate 1-kinase n=1 Tax=Sphenostylis stenocarpa TaxID=92480 RepID=A0AA86S731_9FABA|nr:unnamed protein product [Sphenostylis stenocarpa]
MSGSETEVAAGQRYRVGYALQPNEMESFIQPSLLDYAKQRAIDLIQIDFSTPLQKQGPFHCIIHKIRTQRWKNHLHKFVVAHPNTRIIDPPKFIYRLEDRYKRVPQTVIKDLENLGNDTVRTADQAFIVRPHNLDHIEEWNFTFPIIAKPYEADGGAGSHEMCLVFDYDGIRTLSLPRVLEEFVNHGGVVFKIYVAGRRVNCVKCKTLGDIPEEGLGPLKGVLPLSSVLNSGEDQDDAVEKAEMPPQSLVDELSNSVREVTRLNVFKVNLMRDVKEPTRYVLIDIKYFPAYAKMPSYEPFITDFLFDVVTTEPEEPEYDKYTTLNIIPSP